MRRDSFARTLTLLAAGALLQASAFAGGPLIVSPETRTAYAYGPGPVKVYYDNGDLATGIWNYNVSPAAQVTLTNSIGKHLVEKGFADWSAIPSSSFRATVVGDFKSINLPDINGTNAGLVIGTFNGGGIHVIFDADGTVMSDYLGVPPNVLGISSPEFGIDGTSIITESWTILGGQAIDGGDTDGSNYQGVATHEFGHSIGLAHTQTNGAAYFYGYWGENVGPGSCTTLPYSTNLTKDDVETMYPYSDPWLGGTGPAQAHIHTVDDIAAISDLYPGPSWPTAYGTIKGTIYDTDGRTPLTGVNVIARNLDDPYAGANSTMSGEWTQGMFGPDGTYTIHGLKPGGRYVIYTDAIFAGGYPTYPLWFLPGPERFYNGPQKGKTNSFTSCQYQVITPSAGSTTVADIAFEQIKGAPVVTNLGYGTFVSDISGDGRTAVGTYGRGGPVFTWTEKNGLRTMPNVYASDSNVYISRNGLFLATNLVDANNVDQGAFRWDLKNGWSPVVSKVGSCGTDTTYTWGVTDDGSVYGMAYKTCDSYQGFRWSPRAGLSLLPTATKKADGTPSNSRMNGVSADGSTIVGWEETTARITLPPEMGGGTTEWVGRVASYIRNGRASLVLDASGNTMEEATAVSGDGSIIAGSMYDGTSPMGAGWYKPVGASALSYQGPLPGTSRTDPIAMSKDGSLMVGFAGNAWFDLTPGPYIWSKNLGFVDFNEFLRKQGASMETMANNAWTPMAMSDDGSVVGGWGFGNLANFGWVVQINKAFICHADRGRYSRTHTISVDFPAGLDAHLAHGDTAGACPDYQP
jgi:hypothetical protein